ncbi:hypothetical protein GQ55_5G522500 [Panicum hallii var. hallii]|uniref:Uncharacterized protein n=1 Tax=Panicum hallii var. hallii TaxID=1504633 RepID=A0A2T7DSQ6_9POAL|nr:hypothetical protein GQ55_5G522500 [Panicum hallii var. hallii]
MGSWPGHQVRMLIASEGRTHTRRRAWVSSIDHLRRFPEASFIGRPAIGQPRVAAGGPRERRRRGRRRAEAAALLARRRPPVTGPASCARWDASAWPRPRTAFSAVLWWPPFSALLRLSLLPRDEQAVPQRYVIGIREDRTGPPPDAGVMARKRAAQRVIGGGRSCGRKGWDGSTGGERGRSLIYSRR